jgi:hypothetical protein
MKRKKPTLNKNGSERKSGSGRKKGSNSFVKVPFCDLKDYIGEKTPITVSRVWLESLGITASTDSIVQLPLTEDSPSDKIAYNLKNFEDEN